MINTFFRLLPIRKSHYVFCTDFSGAGDHSIFADPNLFRTPGQGSTFIASGREHRHRVFLIYKLNTEGASHFYSSKKFSVRNVFHPVSLSANFFLTIVFLWTESSTLFRLCVVLRRYWFCFSITAFICEAMIIVATDVKLAHLPMGSVALRRRRVTCCFF